MSSQKLVASVVIVLVGSPFAVAALEAIGIGPNWEVEAPQWEAGYSWTYANSVEGEFKAEWTEHGSKATEQEDYGIRGESKRSVLNTTARIGNTSLYAVVEQWAATSGKDLDELDDGRQEPQTQGGLVETSCVVECPVNHGYYTQSDINPYFEGGMGGGGEDEELRLLDFPLRPGASWSVYRNEEHYGHGFVEVEELEARVAGKDIVNLPGLGNMDAIRVEATFTKESLESWQKSATRGAPSGLEFDMDVDYRLTYWYAPEAKTIVRMDLDQYVEISFSFQGESMYMEHTHRGQEILSDYSLERAPERSLGETQKLRSYLEDLPDVTQLSNETWPFELAQSHSKVNVNAGETTTLGPVEEGRSWSASTLEFDEIPAGMEIKWRHRYLEVDAMGLSAEAREDWYAGETLELSPQTQGLHEVVAYLLDGEKRLVGLDSTIIEGYGEWDVDGAPMVGAFAVTGPATVDFTTNLMLERIEVAVDPGTMGTGTIYVASENTEGSQQYSVTGPDSVQFHEVDPGQVDRWTVEFMDWVRVGELDMTVTARYDRSFGVDGFDSIWTDLAGEPGLGESRSMDPMCTGVMTSCLTKALIERFEERALDGAFPAEAGVLGLPGWH